MLKKSAFHGFIIAILTVAAALLIGLGGFERTRSDGPGSLLGQEALAKSRGSSKKLGKKGGKPGGARCRRDRDCKSSQCLGLGRGRTCLYQACSLKPGMRCRRNSECNSNQCSGVGKNRTCTERLGVLKAGQRCKRNEECESRQCMGLGRNRKCTLARSLKAGQRCKRNEECESGQCHGLGRSRKCTLAAVLKGGQRCTRNEECESGQCTGVGRNRKCTHMHASLPAGARCKRNEECASGQCHGLGKSRRCTVANTKKAGDRCMRDEECQSGQCSGVGRGRRCTQRDGQLKGGDRCKRNDECQSGQCAGVGRNRRCIIRHKKKGGARCIGSIECQSGDCGGLPRRCRHIKGTLKAGQRCGVNRECASGQCSGLGSGRKCTALAGKLKAGLRCKRDAECESGQCSGLGSNRKCTEVTGTLPDGARCKRDKECRSGNCSGVEGRRTCRARKTGRRPPGAGCSRDKECQSGQCWGYGKNRKCTSLVGALTDGASCSKSEECRSGQCRGHVGKRRCVAMSGTLAAGTRCKRDLSCKSGRCDNGQCTHMTGSLLPGDPCRHNSECRYDKCYKGFCRFYGMKCQPNQKVPEIPFETGTSRKGIVLRYLGTYGYELSIDDKRIIIDPYLARAWKKDYGRGTWMRLSSVVKGLLGKLHMGYRYDVMEPRFLKYYKGITRADWIFMTHGHVDHAAEYMGIVVNLAREYKLKGKRYKVGIIGSHNQSYMIDAYEKKYQLKNNFGAQITFKEAPYGLTRSFCGGCTANNRWNNTDRVNPQARVKKFNLGDGISVTWYPSHHSRGASEKWGWGRYVKPFAPPFFSGDFMVDAVHNVLIEARGKRILLMGSNHIHYGDPHKDPLPAKPVDVLILAISEWNTRNADRELKFLPLLKPKVLIPSHYDDYYHEWNKGCRVMEFANLPLFLRKVPKMIKTYNAKGHKFKTDIKVLDYAVPYRIK